ncbi:MAG TPA: hypothetical protein VGE01_10150, partial [Fimbriimonas sp.]
TADILSSASEPFTLSSNGRELTLNYQAPADESVTISSKGQTLDKKDLPRGAHHTIELTNNQSSPVVYNVQMGPRDFVFAVPGLKSSAASSGSGNLSDFAAALADRYRAPVELNVANREIDVTWNFDETKALDAANDVLDNSFSISEIDGNVILIKDR